MTTHRMRTDLGAAYRHNRRSALVIATLFIMAIGVWGGMQAVANTTADVAADTAVDATVGTASDTIAGAATGTADIAAADTRQVQVIDAEGEQYLFPLSVDTTLSFSTDLGHNTIVIDGGYVWMEASTCPNHDCVHIGKINSSAEMILCLPNQFLVTIIGATDDDANAVDTISS